MKPKAKYEVVRAWGMDSRGGDIYVGWDLLCNGEWGQRYRYKSTALASKRWLEANEPYGPSK